MKFVDKVTGKIIGCEKGSLAWFHEEGHIEYSKSLRGMRNQYLQENFFQAAITFLVGTLFIDFFKWGAALSWFLFLCLELYEEAWAWQYARIMKSSLKD